MTDKEETKEKQEVKQQPKKQQKEMQEEWHRNDLLKWRWDVTRKCYVVEWLTPDQVVVRPP